MDGIRTSSEEEVLTYSQVTLVELSGSVDNMEESL